MARADYFRSCLPDTWQILGVRLRPFSLGHLVKLKAFDSPFAADDGEQSITIGDLVLAVAICSMSSHPDPTQDEFWRWWTAPRRVTVFHRLLGRKPLRPAERDIVRWGAKAKSVDIAEKARLMCDYIASHSEVPGYWVIETHGGQPGGSNWIHTVMHGLTAHCGYTQIEACNIPVGKCLFDFLKAAEDGGSVRLMTDEEAKLATQVVLEVSRGA